MHFVYILRCSDKSLYTGWTVNLTNRLNQHRMGKASKYTRARLPLELAYFEILENKSAALKREAAIKKLSRSEKLDLISNFNLPHQLDVLQMDTRDIL